MMGTIQIFHDSKSKNLFKELISHRRFDEEKQRAPIAEILAKNYARYGTTLSDIPLEYQPGNQAYYNYQDLIPAPRRHIRLWNAITCGCPCCRKKMKLIISDSIDVD